MLGPLFLGSISLKNKIIKEIKNNNNYNNSYDPLIKKLKNSENAFNFDLDSKNINSKPYPSDESQYIEELTIKICNSLGDSDYFPETKNSIDQFYPPIYYLLSILIDRFNIISQLNISKREILVPNIKLLKRPFTTMQITMSDQKDIFNS